MSKKQNIESLFIKHCSFCALKKPGDLCNNAGDTLIIEMRILLCLILTLSIQLFNKRFLLGFEKLFSLLLKYGNLCLPPRMIMKKKKRLKKHVFHSKQIGVNNNI